MIEDGFQYWHHESMKGDELAKVLFSTAREIIGEQWPLRQRWLMDARLYYQNRTEVSYGASYGQVAGNIFLNFLDTQYDESSGTPDYDFRSWLMTRAIPDALQSRLLLQQPMPRVITAGAGEAMQERARKKEQGIQALFVENDYWETVERHLLIWLVLGTSFLKVVPAAKGREISSTAYTPDRFVVDEIATRNGKPRVIHHMDCIDKLELMQMYDAPEAKEAIGKSQSVGSAHTRRQAMTLETIRLPCGNEPGRRVVALETGVLSDEPWTRPRFNCCWSRYKDPLQGFYGESMIEELRGPQKELNYILKELRVNLRKQGTTYLEVMQRQQIAEVDSLDSKYNQVITNAADGGARIVNPPPAHNLVFTLLQLHKNACYETTGMNEVSASAQRPPGLDSGEALREWNAIQSERYSRSYHRLERHVADAGQLHADAAAEIEKREGVYEVRLERGEVFDPIPWSKMALDEGSYKVTVYPGSSLPYQPAGRTQAVTSAVNAGAPIDPDEVLGLLQWNDLSRYTDLRLAPIRQLRALFERMISTGEYEAPHPMHALMKAIELAPQYWNYYKEQGIEEERLTLISRYWREAKGIVKGELLEAEAAQAAQVQAEAGPAPGPAPGAGLQIPPDEQAAGTGAIPPELAAQLAEA